MAFDRLLSVEDSTKVEPEKLYVDRSCDNNK